MKSFEKKESNKLSYVSIDVQSRQTSRTILNQQRWNTNYEKKKPTIFEQTQVEPKKI